MARILRIIPAVGSSGGCGRCSKNYAVQGSRCLLRSEAGRRPLMSIDAYQHSEAQREVLLIARPR